jgi:PAS domain S-box-containing protein
VKRSESERTAASVLDSIEVLLDALPRAVLITDGDGTIVTWNASAEVLHRRRPEELSGRSLLEVSLASLGDEQGRRLLEQTRDGATWTGEVDVVRPDGTTATAQLFLGPLRDGDGEVVGLITSAEDVTETERLAQRATSLQDHLALALSAGRLGTWRWDAATGVTVWDAGMERLFGLEPGTFDGSYEGWVSLLHPEDREAALEVLRRAMATQQPYEVEHRVVWPDGTVHWLQGRGLVVADARGRATGTIGCTVDITAQKQLEVETERRTRDAERAAARERLERERLEFLGRLNDATLGANDHLTLMRKVTEAAVPRLGDWCTIHFCPNPGTPPEVEIAHSDPIRVQWARDLQQRFPYDPGARNGVPAVIRSGKLEFIPDIEAVVDALLEEAVEAASRDELRVILDELHLTSMITAPLRTKSGVVGAMQFVSAESRRRYDEADVALAVATAGRVAEALATTWLMEQHREIASTLQTALLPPRLPEIDGISLAVRYWPAGAVTIVGGDFYDVFPLGDERWAIVIGDVCGSGPNAAAVTAIARHTMRAAAMHGAAGADALDWTNLALHAGNRDLFCTAVFSTVEREPGGWRFTSTAAGHPLPLLVREDGEVSTVGQLGSLLGVLPKLELGTASVELRTGDTLVLYTDGVTDVPPPDDLDAGTLALMVRRAADGAASAEVVADRLGRSLHELLPVARRNDDVAIVVARVTG